LGESGVGKSAFVIRYIENRFENFHIVTLGTEKYSKIGTFNSRKYTLNFIVTSGDPQYKTDYTANYKQVDFFLAFYDVSSKKSFDKLKTTVAEELKDYLFSYKNEYPNVIFIGNKSDLTKERKVPYEEVEKYCKINKFDFYEISVRSNLNISKVVNKLMETFDYMANDEEEE
jgi:small GTP-binding protein